MKTYRAIFGYSGGSEKRVLTPASYTVLGYGIKVIHSWYAEGMFYVEFQLLSPTVSSSLQGVREDSAQALPLVAIPVAAIAVGLLVIAGLALTYYNLKEVNEIVDSPSGSFLVLGVVALIGVIIWKAVK